MAITATNNAVKRELIPQGNYVATCYQMIEIGTIKESFQGDEKTLHKVRIGWELPTEQKVFNEEKGMQPCVISKEFTLSMNEKATLRKWLASWRGKDFTESEAKAFDITKLLGVHCLLNIIHKPGSKDPSSIYNEIATISPLVKGMEKPKQINPTFVLSYDDFSQEKFDTLPDFIKDKMRGSEQFKKMQQPTDVTANLLPANSDLPWDNEDSDEVPF